MEEKTKVKVKDVNLFSVVEEIDVLMTKSNYNEDGRELNYAASTHICKKRDCFETLK